MDTDLPDFSGEQSPAPETQVQEPAAPVAAAPQPDPANPPAPDAQPQPATEAAPAAPTQSDAEQAAAMHVPLATFLDMRDRANRHEQEARQLREWRAQQEAAARRQPPPSREEDPEGYEQHREQRFQAALYDQKLSFSERMAVQAHGKDAVAAAKTWYDSYAAQDPFFDRKVASSPDPYEVVITEWKRQQLLTRIAPEDLDAFQDWKAAQAGQAPAAPANPAAGAPPAPPARPAAPRPSIAAAPSAGASSEPRPTGGEETYQRMFGS